MQRTGELAADPAGRHSRRDQTITAQQLESLEFQAMQSMGVGEGPAKGSAAVTCKEVRTGNELAKEDEVKVKVKVKKKKKKKNTAKKKDTKKKMKKKAKTKKTQKLEDASTGIANDALGNPLGLGVERDEAEEEAFIASQFSTGLSTTELDKLLGQSLKLAPSSSVPGLRSGLSKSVLHTSQSTGALATRKVTGRTKSPGRFLGARPKTASSRLRIRKQPGAKAGGDEEKSGDCLDRPAAPRRRAKKLGSSKSTPALKKLNHSQARDLERGWDSQFAQSLTRNKLILRGIGESEKELRSKLTRDRLQLGIQMKQIRRQREKRSSKSKPSTLMEQPTRQATRRPKSAKALATRKLPILNREKTPKELAFEKYKHKCESIVALWQQLKIPKTDRLAFAGENFLPPTKQQRRAFDFRSKETNLQKMLDLLDLHRDNTLKVLHAVKERERAVSCFIDCLAELCKEVEHHEKMDEKTVQGWCKTVVGLAGKAMDATLWVLEAIAMWRVPLWRPLPFLWKGQNAVRRIEECVGMEE